MTFETILDFAIKNEEEAVLFYRKLAERSENQVLKKSLLAFADEEAGHKTKLESLKARTLTLPSKKVVGDMRLSDYLVQSGGEEVTDYQDLLILAMKKEKAAYKLYSDLADRAEDSSLKALLTSLALEEANHKLRFEVEYENIYLTEL